MSIYEFYRRRAIAKRECSEVAVVMSNEAFKGAFSSFMQDNANSELQGWIQEGMDIGEENGHWLASWSFVKPTRAFNAKLMELVNLLESKFPGEYMMIRTLPGGGFDHKGIYNPAGLTVQNRQELACA